VRACVRACVLMYVFLFHHLRKGIRFSNVCNATLVRRKVYMFNLAQLEMTEV